MTYREYMDSHEWYLLKIKAYNRAENCCEHCGSQDRLSVHHVRYPKDWARDSLADVVVLCKAHHTMRHPHASTKDRTECIGSVIDRVCRDIDRSNGASL